jgi:uncharacterized protein YdaT
MPWTKDEYPESMKNLDTNVRNKAIQIANSLVEESNMEKNKAIRIAIKKAKEKLSAK